MHLGTQRSAAAPPPSMAQPPASKTPMCASEPCARSLMSNRVASSPSSAKSKAHPEGHINKVLKVTFTCTAHCSSFFMRAPCIARLSNIIGNTFKTMHRMDGRKRTHGRVCACLQHGDDEGALLDDLHHLRQQIRPCCQQPLLLLLAQLQRHLQPREQPQLRRRSVSHIVFCVCLSQL